MTVLLEPIITEKAMNQAARGWYTFSVTRDSKKPEIRQEVEQNFKVHVKKIRTITIAGSWEKSGRRGLKKRTPIFKKAIVRLADKETIGLFQVENAPKK